MATVKLGQPRDFYKKMVGAGVNLFRLNFNFYSPEQDEEVITRFIKDIREISQKFKLFIGICADVRGPTFKTILKESIKLQAGDKLTFSAEGDVAIDVACPSFYSQLKKKAKPGDLMLIDHAQSVLKIEKINDADKKIEAVSLNDYIIESNKNISFPGVSIRQYPITPQDKMVIEYAKKKEIDYIIQSYVQSGDDIREMRKLLKGNNDPLIITKVETETACREENLSNIINSSDAILIGRGHLADELSNRLDLPIIQRKVIKKALEHGKPVWVGTEIYYSMVPLYFPARVDMENVCSMISDNIDGLMLAGETINSKDPVRVIRVLTSQIKLCEEYFKSDNVNYPLVKDIKQARKFALKKEVYSRLN